MNKESGLDLHFTWFFLAVALVLGAASVIAFSFGSLHALNDTRQLSFDFPGSQKQWKVRGEDTSFRPCGASVCLHAGHSSSTLLVDIDTAADVFAGVDQLLYEVVLSDYSDASPARSTGRPEFIVARARSNAGKLLKNIGSVIPLDDKPVLRMNRRVSSLHPQTAGLQLVVAVRNANNIAIESVQFYTVRLSDAYKAIRVALFSAWAILLLFLTLRVLWQIPLLARVISAVMFTLILVVGASEYASMITKRVRSYMDDSLIDNLTGYLAISQYDSFTTIHFTFHLILTLLLAIFSTSPNLTYKQIFAVNLIIAIGVECTQMGMPARAADLHDLWAAMLGASAGMLLLSIIKLAHGVLIRHSDDWR